jgi:hypothetical protein
MEYRLLQVPINVLAQDGKECWPTSQTAAVTVSGTGPWAAMCFANKSSIFFCEKEKKILKMSQNVFFLRKKNKN